MCRRHPVQIPEPFLVQDDVLCVLFGATHYNQHQGFCSDTEATDTQNCLDNDIQSEVAGAKIDWKHSTVMIKITHHPETTEYRSRTVLDNVVEL